MGIAATGRSLNGGAPRIAQPQKTGHLVESFTGCIIHGGATELIDARAVHPHQLCVATGDQQHQKRWFRRWAARQPGRAEVTLQMMNRQEGLAMEQGHGLAGGETHQQGPHQAGGGGGGNGTHLVPADAGLPKGLVHQMGQEFHVSPCGQLRHNSAVGGMAGHLTGHHVGQDLLAIGGTTVHQGHRCLITTCFEGQNDGQRSFPLLLRLQSTCG